MLDKEGKYRYPNPLIVIIKNNDSNNIMLFVVVVGGSGLYIMFIVPCVTVPIEILDSLLLYYYYYYYFVLSHVHVVAGNVP